MSYNPKDHYFKKAKKEGFKARSVYKLDEIQDKHRLIKGGQRVLDLGAAPGSWSQLIQKIIGPKGFLLGIDLQPITVNYPNAKFLRKDIRDLVPEDFDTLPFDVVVSDMAPKTTGVALRDQAESENLCVMVIDVAEKYLRPGGNLAMKYLMGSGFKDLEARLKLQFREVRALRPKGTRSQSSEIFFVGKNKVP